MNVKLSFRISLWYVRRLFRYWKEVEKQKLLLYTNTIKCSIWGKSQQGTSFLEHFRNFLVLRFPKVLRCFQFWVSGNFLFHSCQAKILFKRSQILWSHLCICWKQKNFTNGLNSVVWVLRLWVEVTLHICQILVDLKLHQGKCKLYPIHFF